MSTFDMIVWVVAMILITAISLWLSSRYTRECERAADLRIQVAMRREREANERERVANEREHVAKTRLEQITEEHREAWKARK